MVDLRYVFSLRRVENDRSAVLADHVLILSTLFHWNLIYGPNSSGCDAPTGVFLWVHSHPTLPRSRRLCCWQWQVVYWYEWVTEMGLMSSSLCHQKSVVCNVRVLWLELIFFATSATLEYGWPCIRQASPQVLRWPAMQRIWSLSNAANYIQKAYDVKALYILYGMCLVTTLLVNT